MTSWVNEVLAAPAVERGQGLCRLQERVSVSSSLELDSSRSREVIENQEWIFVSVFEKRKVLLQALIFSLRRS